MKLKQREGWVLPVITALAVGIFVVDLIGVYGKPFSLAGPGRGKSSTGTKMASSARNRRPSHPCAARGEGKARHYAKQHFASKEAL